MIGLIPAPRFLPPMWRRRMESPLSPDEVHEVVETSARLGGAFGGDVWDDGSKMNASVSFPGGQSSITVRITGRFYRFRDGSAIRVQIRPPLVWYLLLFGWPAAWVVVCVKTEDWLWLPLAPVLPLLLWQTLGRILSPTVEALARTTRAEGGDLLRTS